MIFRCNTYPDLGFYAAGQLFRFTRGRFDTSVVEDEEARSAVEALLQRDGTCYQDDGTLECPWPDCQQPFASQLGLERHLRDLHGGVTPQAFAEARAGVTVSLPVGGEERLEQQVLESEPPVRAVRGVKRAVAE